MQKPELTLVKLSSLTPEKRALALADLYERLTGRRPTAEETAAVLARAAAAGGAAGRR